MLSQNRQYPWLASYPAGVRWSLDYSPVSIPEMVRRAVNRWHDKTALSFEGRDWSYVGIACAAEAFAARLSHVGITVGDRVALLMNNAVHYPVAFLAAMSMGAVVVNLSPLDPPAQVSAKLRLTGAKALVTMPGAGFAAAAERCATDIPGLVVICADGSGTLPLPADAPQTYPSLNWHPFEAADVPPSGPADLHVPAADALAVLQFTGGTTGTPKAARLLHRNFTAAVAMFDQWTGGDDPILSDGRETILGILPLFHIFSLTVVLLSSLRNGARIVLHPGFDAARVLAAIEAERVSVLPGVPTMFTALVNHPAAAGTDFSSLRFCRSGGSPLPREIAERFEALTGQRLCEHWGMTETAPAGTGTPPRGQFRADSVGLPMPGLTVEVRAPEHDRVYPWGQVGELCVAGPNVFDGYMTAEGPLDAVGADGFFRTGDLGRIDPDGFIYLVDRKKDMIISSGFNVYPKQVEEAIYRHPAVLEAALVGVPDGYRGQSGHAFVVLKPGHAPFDLDTLQTFLADKVGRHEIPRGLSFLDALPKSAVGKVLKPRLAERAAVPSTEAAHDP